MTNKRIFCSLLAFLPLAVSAQVKNNDLQLNSITTAVPFMAITPDSRAGGMGDAGTALSGDANSVYWNTSMLNFAKNDAEISLSYTPWLRQLTNDMSISYLSGYKKINKRSVVGGSLRYFSMGEINFTDNSGNPIRTDKPSEFAVTGAYAFKLSDKMSIGINGKFIYSNLTGGLTVSGVDTKAGLAGAADISYTYYNEDAKIGKTDGVYTFAATINNIGNKIAYSSLATRDFLPTNLKIGNSFKAVFDKYNSLTFSLDLQKLLVPTPAYYADVDGDGTADLVSGKNSDVGVIQGIIQSFYDAPGAVSKVDGEYVVAKGSRLKEELNEINIAFGMEYWYNDLFALRGGVFYESKTKGNRQYVELGFGLKYNSFGFDFSYLAALNQNNPLANTLRFGLRYVFGNKKAESAEEKPQ